MIHDDIYFGICTGRRGPSPQAVPYANESFVGLPTRSSHNDRKSLRGFTVTINRTVQRN